MSLPSSYVYAMVIQIRFATTLAINNFFALDAKFTLLGPHIFTDLLQRLYDLVTEHGFNFLQRLAFRFRIEQVETGKEEY